MPQALEPGQPVKYRNPRGDWVYAHYLEYAGGLKHSVETDRSRGFMGLVVHVDDGFLVPLED